MTAIGCCIVLLISDHRWHDSRLPHQPRPTRWHTFSYSSNPSWPHHIYIYIYIQHVCIYTYIHMYVQLYIIYTHIICIYIYICNRNSWHPFVSTADVCGDGWYSSILRYRSSVTHRRSVRHRKPWKLSQCW